MINGNANSKKELKEAVQKVIQELMDKVLKSVLQDDPFIKEKHHAEKPLYAALVPDEIFKGSHFERRFVTPFGKVWEKLAAAVASKRFGYAEIDHTISGIIKEERLRRITQILNELEHETLGQPRRRPNWEEELAFILEGEGEEIPFSVVCDVYAEDIKNERKYAFEIKAPLPNSDQTKVSKEKLLKLYCMEGPKLRLFLSFLITLTGKRKTIVGVSPFDGST